MMGAQLHLLGLWLVMLTLAPGGVISSPYPTEGGVGHLTCGALRQDRGVVSSHTAQDEHYPTDQNWCVVIDTDGMVELDFDPSFDIEPKYGASECRYDFVEIRQRYGSSDEEVLGRFCGLEAPQFAPLEGPVYIEFLSDDRITGYGWTVEFEVEGAPANQDSCLMLSDNSGTIQSDNYPDNYPSNVEDCFIITNDQRVQLFWDSPFHVGSRFQDGDCQNDFLEIYEGTTSRSEDSLRGRYCGSSIPRTLVLSAPVYIRFHSDSSGNEQGWRMSWDADLPMDLGANGRYDCTYQTGESGLLTSENYPNKYPANSDYCIVIDVTERVTMMWDDTFDVDSKDDNTACRFDFVELRSQYSSDNLDNIVDSLCGDTSPGLQTLEGPVMIRHHSDGFVNGHGWSFQWISESYDPPAQEIECDIVDRTSGRLTSDNYPNNYDTNTNWCVTINLNELIVLDWDRDFHVAGEYFGDQCRYDYVEVQSQYRPENPGGEMQTWCGDYSPGMNQVLGPVVIRHVSDWANTADGWSLQWTAESHDTAATHGCRMRRTTSGTITSDNYPKEYANDVDSCTIIDADEMVTLQWASDFNVESQYFHGTCKYDYVEVRQRYSSSNPNDIVGTYCGTTAPRVQDIRGPVMITHHSDWILSGIGWSVNFITESYSNQAPDPIENCGEINPNAGTVHSNFYPNYYPNDIDWCRYINGPVVHIQFDDYFSIQDDPGCSLDYVEIQSAADGIDRFCGSTAPAPTTYQGPVIIRFHTDGLRVKKGFSLEYTVTQN